MTQPPMADGVPGRQHLTGYRLRDYDDLIAKLAASRESQGVTQAEVALRVGVTQSAVSDWLDGRISARRDRLFKLADALGYDLALIDREEPDEVAPDLEPAPSAATIASVMAIVDAPYQPGLDVRFEEDA